MSEGDESKWTKLSPSCLNVSMASFPESSSSPVVSPPSGLNGSSQWAGSSASTPVFIGSLAHLALGTSASWAGVLEHPLTVVSHLAAARLHRLPGIGTPDAVSLTLPHTIRRTTGGVQWHRSSRLRAQDVVLVDGLPVTDLARTVVDLAKVLDRHGFEAVLDDALAARRVNFAAIEHCADLLGTAGRTGSAISAP